MYESRTDVYTIVHKGDGTQNPGRTSSGSIFTGIGLQEREVVTVHAVFAIDNVVPVYLSAIQTAIFENDIHFNRLCMYAQFRKHHASLSVSLAWNMSRTKLRACDEIALRLLEEWMILS